MKTNQLLIVIMGVMLSGCVNSVYKGESTYLEKDGTDQAVGLYWNTTGIFGWDTTKATVVTIQPACRDYRTQYQAITGSSRHEFHEADDYFTPITNHSQKVDTNTLRCGVIDDLASIMSEERASMDVSLWCDKLSDAKSPSLSLPAKEAPYVFTITSESKWSFFGGEIEPPIAPVCRE